MTFADQADLSRDGDFRDRIAACVATQDVDLDGHPLGWADFHQWRIAAAPGFAAAYASALANEVERPGRDTSVISDADLLAAVQDRLAPTATA